MGDLYRFKRRLLSRGRGTRVYQVPTLRLQRQSLRVPGAPLRSVDGSQSLHKDREGHRGLPQSTRCRYAPVLGRLADEKSDPGSPEYVLFPSERRILRATRLAASLLARTAQPAKTWQRFLGHLSSLRELVPMAVVHSRPYVRIYPNEATLAELEWWTSQANLRVGCPFLHPDSTMSIVTDASKEGWGGYLGDWVVSGHWSRAWA